MSEKVEFRVEYTEPDFIRGMITALDRSGRNWITIGITAASLLLGFSFVYWYVFRDSRALGWSDVITALVALIVSVPFAILLSGYRPFTESGIGQMYKDNSILREEYLVEVDLDGIGSQSDSFQNKVKWEAFIEAFETNEDIYFLLTKQQPLFFPKRAIKPEQISTVKQIAIERMGTKAKFLR